MTTQMQLNKSIEKMTNDLGRTPTEEVRSLRKDVDLIVRSMVNCVSLNAVVGDNSELEELVGGVDKTEDFDTITDCELLLSKLKQEVSPRDYAILIKRFGLDGEGSRTLSELAEEYELTRSRCHQVERQMIHALVKLDAPARHLWLPCNEASKDTHTHKGTQTMKPVLYKMEGCGPWDSSRRKWTLC